MTKLGSTSAGIVSGGCRGTEKELRIPVVSTWREEFLGVNRVAETLGDDVNELWEEDIWGRDLVCEESNKDVAIQKSRADETDESGTKGAFEPKKVRSLLSVEIEATGFGQSDICTSLHTRKDGLEDAGWSDEAPCRKTSLYPPHLGNDPGEGRQYRGTAGLALSVASEAAGFWGELLENGAGAEEEEKDEDREAQLVPPHELVARQYAKSEAMAFSLFEGAGRTLKGMDLRRLRNAVWRQTGFMG